MYFKFKCSHCGNDLKIAEEKAGLKARCPYCDGTVVVPAPPWMEAGEGEGAAAQEASAQEASADRQAPSSPAPADAKPPPKRPREKRPSRERAGKRRQEPARSSDQPAPLASGTDVPALQSIALGVAMAAGFYVLVLPFGGTHFGALFLRRGWVPFVEVILMGWAVGILVLKWRKLRHQRAAMLLDVLPSGLGEEIAEGNVDRFIDHVKRIPPHLRDSIMVNRIRRALEHFRVRRSNPEVASMLAAQSEIDASAVHSSYTMIRVLIWSIPILGFIGTVLGISDAVAGFSESLDQAQDIEVLKASLNDVTAGLAVAFDTTLVALCMSVLASFPAHSIQKSEEDLLNWVDEYCGENLLKRLNDAGAVSAVASHTQALVQSLGAAVADEQKGIVRELRAAAQSMTRVQGEQVKHFHTVARAIDEQAHALEHRAVGHQAKVEESLTRMTEGVEQAMAAMAERLTHTADSQSEHIDANASAHRGAIEAALRDLVAAVREAMEQVVERNAAIQRDSTQTIHAHVAALEEGIATLNGLLRELGGKQVVVRRPPPWWWPFGRKSQDSADG
jgi:DNA-directed RNA polymerase subunit RPC12/RpoP